MSLKRQRGPCRAKLPEEVRTLRLHKDCGGAVCEVRRRVKKVCIQEVRRVSHVIFTQKGGITGVSMLAVRCGAAESITDAEDISCLLKAVPSGVWRKHICWPLWSVSTPPPTQIIPLFQEKRLCAHPFLEIYRDGQIHFMAPLARQGDFYVPEVRRVERRPPVKDGLQSDSEVSGIIKSILFTRSTSETFLRTL